MLSAASHCFPQAGVLSRALGLPEAEPAAEEADGVSQERPEEAATGAEEDLDDMELMASLEAVEEGSLDSGYRSASVLSSGPSGPSGPSGYRSASVLSSAPSRPSSQQHVPLEDSAWGSPLNAPEEDFPDDDIPLDELDSVLSQQHVSQEAGQGDVLSPPEPTLTISPQLSALRQSAYTPGPQQEHSSRPAPSQPAPLRAAYTPSPQQELSSRPAPSQPAPLRADRGSDTVSEAEQAVGWDSPPFSYLLNLQLSGNGGTPREVRVHAFVVTLKGSMRSAGGHWSLDVCISDGSAYVDAEMGDGVLAELIGFSAAEARALRRTPEGQAQVNLGIQRCQRALVDMCGIMTLRTDPQQARPLVLGVKSATQSDCLALQQRVELRRARH